MLPCDVGEALDSVSVGLLMVGDDDNTTAPDPVVPFDKFPADNCSTDMVPPDVCCVSTCPVPPVADRSTPVPPRDRDSCPVNPTAIDTARSSAVDGVPLSVMVTLVSLTTDNACGEAMSVGDSVLNVGGADEPDEGPAKKVDGG